MKELIGKRPSDLQRPANRKSNEKDVCKGKRQKTDLQAQRVRRRNMIYGIRRSSNTHDTIDRGTCGSSGIDVGRVERICSTSQCEDWKNLHKRCRRPRCREDVTQSDTLRVSPPVPGRLIGDEVGRNRRGGRFKVVDDRERGSSRAPRT
nr:hypothetical protein CFP56_31560 [Quercus suber]